MPESDWIFPNPEGNGGWWVIVPGFGENPDMMMNLNDPGGREHLQYLFKSFSGNPVQNGFYLSYKVQSLHPDQPTIEGLHKIHSIRFRYTIVQINGREVEHNILDFKVAENPVLVHSFGLIRREIDGINHYFASKTFDKVPTEIEIAPETYSTLRFIFDDNTPNNIIHRPNILPVENVSYNPMIEPNEPYEPINILPPPLPNSRRLQKRKSRCRKIRQRRRTRRNHTYK